MRDSEKSGKKSVEMMEKEDTREAKLKSTRHVSKRKRAGEKTLRKTGIDILGDVPWGTHFCLFYNTKQDLINILVPYFRAGLENNEFCMWVVSEPLNAEDAKGALRLAVRDLDAYINKGQIEILDYSDWYTKTGQFEANKVLQGWAQKHDSAVERGFDGLRLTGNTFWLQKKDWGKFADYEAVVNGVIGKYKMLAVCTYSLERCGASEILDVEHNHQFSLIKWKGNWKVFESSDRNQLDARLANQTMISKVLEHSEKEWVETFNAISDWVALVDLEGRILRTNRIGEKFTGAPLDEIMWQSCCKLVHGSEKHIPNCPLEKMLETGQHSSAELQVSGDDRWLMVTVDPVRNEKGNIIAAVHVTRDITERKRAEQEIEDLARFPSENPNPVLRIRSDGIILYANTASTELLKERNSAVGQPAPAEWCKAVNRSLDSASVVTIEVEHQDKTYVFKTKPVVDAGYCNFYGLDITERKKAYEALQESESKYRALFNKMLSGFAYCKIIVDGNGKPVDLLYLEVNDAFERFTGLKKEDVLGKKITEAIPGVRETHPEIFDIYGKVALTGEEAQFDIYFKPLEVWLSISVYSPRKGYFVAVFENITERKQAEQALRESEERLRTALDAATLGIWDWDLITGKITWAGHHAQLFGYKQEEFDGRYETFRKRVHPQDLPGLEVAIEKSQRDGTEYYREYRVVWPDGTVRWVSGKGICQYDDEGQAVRMTGTVQDITERKKAEEDLCDSRNMLQTILDTIPAAVFCLGFSWSF